MGAIKFTIPEPCHEDWQNMNTTEQGRFCLSCKKDVVDFSRMSDIESAKILFAGEANICGRLSPHQMNAGIKYGVEKSNNWVKYFFSILLPAVLFTKQSAAQGKIIKRTVIQKSIPTKEMIRPFLNRSFGLSGSIANSATNEIISDATITLKGTGYGVAVNNEGNFNFNGKVSGSTAVIRITAMGYESREIEITIPGNNFVLTGEKFYLKKQVVQLETVTVNATLPKNFSVFMGGIGMRVKVNRVKEFPKRIITAITDSIKIMPNPIIRGSSFQVSLKVRQAGNHTIQIIDLAGRIIFQQLIAATAKKYDGRISCDSRWSAGVYIMRVMGSGNSTVSSTRFIVE